MIKSFFFILSLLSFPCWAASINFEAKEYLPQDQALYLNDIAVLSTEDDQALTALKAIKVADSAQEAENMSVQEIIRKIKPQLKVIERHCDCKLQIHIPKEVLEHSLLGRFSEEKLLSRVQKTILKACPLCEVEIQNSNLLKGTIPEQYARWSSPLEVKSLKGASMVRVYFDENALNPLIYQMLVIVKKPVLKLVQPLPAGAQPQRSDVEIAMLDITHEHRDLATVSDIPNTELKRSLGAGEILSLNDLILKYAVKIGETIKVIVQNQSFEMEMTGVAQKHGRVGDKIPVRIAKTHKDVFGEILADGRVAL